MDISPKYVKYQNGMRFMSLQNKSFQSMIIYFYVKVGSKDESKEVNGISHFLEHMLFKGTKKYPTYKDINGVLDSKGIDFNAFTYKNMTAYYFKFLPKEQNLKLVCNMIYEMLFHSLNKKKDLDVERNVVIQEFNEMLDTPDDYVNDIIEEFIFQDHSLGMPIIGNKKTINNIDTSDIKTFYDKYYQPENIFISLTGNFPFKYIDIIEEKFIKSKKIVKNPELPCIPITPFNIIQKEQQLKYVPRKLQQTFLTIAFPIGGLFDSDNNIYKLISNILGGHMSSRLFVKVREELGLTYSISCSVSNYEESGYFSIDTKTEPNKTNDAFRAILKELVNIKKHKVLNTELKSNQTNYCDIFKSNFDELENLAEYYGEQYLFNNKIETVSDRIKNINLINSQKILEVCNKLFDFNKMMVVCYGHCNPKKINGIISEFK